MSELYEGETDYIVVSYARADEKAALPIMNALTDTGYRVWYDKAIEAGAKFPDRIADRVHDCACVLMLVSRAYLASDWCKNEVNYALDLKKTILPIYLEDVELPRAWQMRLGTVQALFWHTYDSDEEFNKALFAVKMLDSCLTAKGKSYKGVKPRVAQGPENAAEPTPSKDDTSDDTAGSLDDQTKTDDAANRGGETRPPQKLARVVMAVAAIVICIMVGNALWAAWHRGDTIEPSAEESQTDVSVPGVPAREKLDDYKWSELKSLSRAIADAWTNYEWMEIAKSYNLVDEDGKLQGDQKVFTLDDGTKTSIRILGFRQDELVSGGRSGITFEFADIPATHWMNEEWTNEGGWEKSNMRAWINSEFLSRLPEGLQSCIESARKKTNNSGPVDSEDDTSVVTAPKEGDRLWLLCVSEVYGSVNGLWSSATYDAEGTQYKLYADQGVTAENYAFCVKGGAGSWWWLRSPNANNSRNFLGVYSDGDWSYWDNADYEGGVSPGFCF